MHDRLLSLGAVALAAVWAGSAAAPNAFQLASQGKSRSVFVSITDKAGAPAKDVTAADIAVREDGQAREVLTLGPATAPMRIALLIDNSQATRSMVNEIRAGMTAFITLVLKASPESTMSIATFGDRPTPVQDFTSSTPVLARAAQRTFPLAGAGAYLLDAVLDAAKSMTKTPAPRQMIVAFVDESGEEFSNSGQQQVTAALRASGASLWVVTVQGGTATPTSIEARDRSAVVGDVTTQSGGTSLSILNRLALPDRMKELAALLTSQFQLTYGRPDQLVPASKLDIQLARKDLRIRAPRWTGQ